MGAYLIGTFISEQGACEKKGCLINGGKVLRCFDFHMIPQGVLGGRDAAERVSHANTHKDLLQCHPLITTIWPSSEN